MPKQSNNSSMCIFVALQTSAAAEADAKSRAQAEKDKLAHQHGEEQKLRAELARVGSSYKLGCQGGCRFRSPNR